ncbi:hypothetical protein HPDFL43_16431 [Hoeflea phototrophica DFL-43]|uniref:Uncharacterized protein n=1 Tax=Hoeflea phototrophica (strain DSM 17068 / NCIMB 14078 / DFL-43) TaxID=411684 RepID=A9D7H7_HOEPD|nr:hypothetical protein [Hoeflea phototrophica]EDQ33080.2 hypothetical protein HPDFL43_16431 [Hoeflea phototrophica DFL-43]
MARRLTSLQTKLIACTTVSALGLLAGVIGTNAIASDISESDTKPVSAAPIQLAQLLPPQGQQQSFVVNRFENRTGVPIDILVVRNGAYQLLGTLGPNMSYDYQTQFADQLAFGYAGQTILATHTITGSLGQTITIPLGPELLARAGIQAPQQQAQPQLPPAQQQGQVAQTLPPTVDPNAAPAVGPGSPPPISADEAVPRQNAEFAAMPQRQSFSDRPWAESPLTSYMIWPGTGTSALMVNVHGEIDYVPIKQNLSNGTWFLEEIEGTNRLVIRNVQFPDKALYIDRGASGGAQVRFGPEGLNSELGQWTKEPRGDLVSFHPVSNPSLYLSGKDGGLSVLAGEVSAAYQGVWFAHTVRDMRELMGVMQDLAPAFSELNDNINELERSISEEKRAALEAEEKARIDRARQPWISSGGNGSDQMVMRLGVNPAEEPIPDVHGVRFNYDVTPYPAFVKGPFQSKDGGNFNVQLQLRPEVYAWAENGKLYVRVKTSDGTSLSILENGLKPQITDTENTYYLAGANVGMWLTGAQAIRHSPANINSVTDAGVSSDQTVGFDLSLESLGGNFSSSRGTNASYQAYDYRISGGFDRGGVSYKWEGCGLAVTVSRADNCTYSGPQDLWVPEDNTVRNLKDISLDMPLMLTDSVYVIDPSQIVWDENSSAHGMVNIGMYVGFNLHAVDIQDVRNTNATESETFWEQFKGGFEFVYRPDLWDFNSSLNDQAIVRKHTIKAVPYGGSGQFIINLRADVSQLKPFLN